MSSIGRGTNSPLRRRGGIPRLRPEAIPLLSYGFRPFFLGAALWALAAMVLWIGVISNWWTFAHGYGALAWHAHEFLFGYVSAVLTGFLLTAIPNWTGRLPLQGRPLLALFLLWLAGRIAMLATDQIGIVAAAVIDCTYLLALTAVILREIIVGKNWRNLKVTTLVAAMALANILFQAEVLVYGAPDYGIRLGVALMIVLIMLVGGKITPSFTHNWLARQQSAKLPAPLGRFDMISIAITGGALVSWIAAPNWTGTADSHHRGVWPSTPIVALGRRTGLARTDRAHPASRLCVRASGRAGAWCVDPLARNPHPDWRSACLDDGSYRNDDAGGDDTGKSRAHRARNRRQTTDDDHLRRHPRRRCHENGGVDAAVDLP